MSAGEPDAPANPNPYIAGLRLTGRRVVVVGGGQVSARRVAGLLDSGAVVELVSPHATPVLDALAADRRITWHERPYQTGDLRDAWYAVAATNDPAVNGAVAAEAEAERVWCSRADDAASSTVWTPAVGRHAGIEVAVLSPGVMNGGDPRRSQRVRDAVVEGLREGTLNAPRYRERPAGVALVGGGPGDPDLITVRGRRLLAEADTVVADRLAPRALLDELASDVELIDASKIPYGRAMAQQEINQTLIERAKAGRFVVRLKGGDPYVFGRGYEELQACTEAGIAVLVVPGVTSAIAVPELAGVPVTHRALTHEFTVVSGHLVPDNPDSLVNWAAVAQLGGTLVLMMAVERIGAIAATLIAHGKDPATPLAAVQDGSTPEQRTVFSTLGQAAADLGAAGVRPPAIVVLGPVVALGQSTDTHQDVNRGRAD